MDGDSVLQGLQLFIAITGAFSIIIGAAAWFVNQRVTTHAEKGKAEIIEHMEAAYMRKDLLELRFKGIQDDINRLQSPPVVDALNAMRLRLIHIEKSLDKKRDDNAGL